MEVHGAARLKHHHHPLCSSSVILWILIAKKAPDLSKRARPSSSYIQNTTGLDKLRLMSMSSCCQVPGANPGIAAE